MYNNAAGGDTSTRLHITIHASKSIVTRGLPRSLRVFIISTAGLLTRLLVQTPSRQVGQWLSSVCTP